jgi:MSHA pilin protein MshC
MMMKSYRGFTLVELIITIILIGILATTVAPKFFTSEGYQEYTYRADIINKLRAIQLRAMQQTDGSKCHQVLIDTKKLGLPDQACKTSSSAFTSDWQASTTDVAIEGNHDVSLSASEDRILFDSLGKPDDACVASGCTITVIGSESLVIKIESEGYIHAI